MTTITRNPLRDKEILEMWLQGNASKNIAEKFNLSRQRIEVIIKKELKVAENPRMGYKNNDPIVYDGFVYENLKKEICKKYRSVRNFCNLNNLEYSTIKGILIQEEPTTLETLDEIIKLLDVNVGDVNYLLEKKIVKRFV